MSGSGKGSGPSDGGGDATVFKRSSSTRRLSTEAAELALHLDGIDLADLEEAVEEEQEQEEAGGKGADQGGAPPRSNTSDISAEVAELTQPDLNDRWAAAAACPAPSGSRVSSRRSSREKNSQLERQRDDMSESRAAAASAASGPQRRTSTHTYSSDANRSAGSLFSTGSHGSFGFGSGGSDPAIIGVLKGSGVEEDDSNNKGSPDGEGDAGGGIRPAASLPRRGSQKSIDLGGFDEDDSVDAATAASQDKSAAAGVVVMPSRGFNASSKKEDDAPPSPSRPRRQTPPARYDPDAIGKILGPDDDDADAEEAAWSELGKYERSIGFKPGRSRRASDYAQDNDADADFEKEWGDMVAVSAVGCGRGRLNAHTLRVACGVLAFVAAAVAVGIGTFAGVEQLVSSSVGGVAADAPTPIAEMSEEDRIQGALPTPTPPEPPSDLADVCSVESFSSAPSSEQRCREVCTAAECCFLDGELNAALSCKDDHPDTCQEYESYCAALDLKQQ